LASSGSHTTPVTAPRDISALFVLAIAAGPFLLPVIGVDVGDIGFAVPALFLGAAAIAGFSTAGRARERRAIWVWLALAATAAAVASGIALASSLANVGLKGAFYLGLLGTAGLLGGAIQMARRGWPSARPEQLFDGLLIGLLVLALGIYYVALPGFAHGDGVLTVIFLADLVALLLALPAAGSYGWSVGGALVAMLFCAVLGDGLVAPRQPTSCRSDPVPLRHCGPRPAASSSLPPVARQAPPSCTRRAARTSAGPTRAHSSRFRWSSPSPRPGSSRSASTASGSGRSSTSAPGS
jgi:hypothetical protein